MRRLILMLTLALAMLGLGPAAVLAQSRAQLGPLCTSEGTPADQQIDACNKIIALKVFSGAQLATVYFWRSVGWNKKGNYPQVISDTTVQQMLTRVRAEVVAKTSGKQVPWSNSSLLGEVYLAAK